MNYIDLLIGDEKIRFRALANNPKPKDVINSTIVDMSQHMQQAFSELVTGKVEVEARTLYRLPVFIGYMVHLRVYFEHSRELGKLKLKLSPEDVPMAHATKYRDYTEILKSHMSMWWPIVDGKVQLDAEQ